MQQFKKKLEAGTPVRVLVLGDSIARGSDATVPSRGFVSLWADAIHERYGSRVEVTNLSVGGATSRTARRMVKHVTPANFDLCVVAVGVNDAAKHTPLRKFRRTIQWIGCRIDTVVVTPLIPTNGDVLPYARALRESGFPVADVTSRWNGLPLANGVNHPDDAGHELYANVLLAATTEPAVSRAVSAS